MIKRFIVLIDFSTYSSNLLKYVCDWSKEVKVEILLLHHTTVLTPGLTDDTSKERMTQHAIAQAHQKLASLAAEIIPDSVKVSFLVTENHLQYVLPDLLAEPYENLIF